MSLKKQYLKKNSSCKVTFSLPKEAAGSAAHVSLVGDFNAWNKDAIPMKRLKNGGFTATLTLQANKEYHFRYFLDGERWENDWNADKYVPNRHGSDDQRRSFGSAERLGHERSIARHRAHAWL